MTVIDSFSGDYAFLSNFYALPRSLKLPFDDTLYWTVENAYQAAKSRDTLERRRIAQMTPGQAKRAGRRMTMTTADLKLWDETKLSMMEMLLRQKFAMEPLRTQLISTQSAQLIEGNDWHDMFWGMIRSPRGLVDNDAPKWVGQNHLGRLLMQIRLEVAK